MQEFRNFSDRIAHNLKSTIMFCRKVNRQLGANHNFRKNNDYVPNSCNAGKNIYNRQGLLNQKAFHVKEGNKICVSVCLHIHARTMNV